MKILFLLFSVLFLAHSVRAEDAGVSVGMEYSVLKKRLEIRGIEVGSKNGPAIFVKGDGGALRFARLDEQATLLIHYSEESQKVTALSLHLVSNGPPSLSHDIVRAVSAIEILDNGAFRVTMKRK